MLSKNVFRPAYATASCSKGQSSIDKKLSSFAFASSEENDFNSFSRSSSGSSAGGFRSPKKPQKKTVTLEIPGKTLAIAAAVILGFVLLISLISGALFSGSDDIMYEDNAFAAFEDLDGTYRVTMNGKVIKDVFLNEVKLTAAKNNSFAYVETVVDDATNVYLLDNNKLKLLCEGVDKVLSLADYAPGVVYKYGDRVEYFYDGLLTSLARNDDHTPENFVISPDGTAIAYTIKNKNDSSIKDLYVYTVDQSGPEARSIGTVSTLPVSISNNGDYVVAYTESGDSKDLYLMVQHNKYRIGNIDGSFDSLVCTNAYASEIVFTTKSGTDYRTYIYNCTERKKDVTVAHHVSNGYAVPQIIDPKLCTPESFKKCYFQDIKASLTIYVNKKYEAIKVSDYLGKIDENERFLYIINEQREDMLIQIELLGERFGKDNNRSTSIATDVKDFVLTQKGNIYYTDGYGDLYFFKLAKGKAARITNDVDKLSFYDYANELYFEKIDSVETHGTYRTSEGSDHETFKFGKTTLTTLPTFTNTYSKNSYACYYDDTTDNYLLFYTSNGNSFKQIAECEKITSSSVSYLKALIDDLLS